jgi:hypothetical protein
MNKNGIIITILSVILILSIVENIRFMVNYKNLTSEYDVLKSENSSLRDRILEDEERANLQKHREYDLQEVHPTVYFISHAEISKLEENGLQNPIEDIKNSLINNQSEILTDSLIDGPQRFWRDYILLLKEDRVLAYWESGHRGGYVFASYDIKKNGEIKWNIIDKID